MQAKIQSSDLRGCIIKQRTMQIPKSSSASGNVRCVRLALAVRPVFRSMAEGVGDQSSSHRHRLAYQTSSPPAHLSSRASRLSQRSSPLAPTAHPIISLGETREVRRFSNLPPLQHATPISPEPSAPHVTQAAPISTDEYHALSDSYIDNLVAQLEEMQEEREEVDVEYSVSLLFSPTSISLVPPRDTPSNSLEANESLTSPSLHPRPES